MMRAAGERLTAASGASGLAAMLAVLAFAAGSR